MDERRETTDGTGRTARRAAPRFGSFVTITAAILLLFGAASRVGKIPETAALFGIDRQAERLRQEEERLRTAITLGAMPSQSQALRPPSGSLAYNPNVLPPPRNEVDVDDLRQGGRAPVSIAVRNHAVDGGDDAPLRYDVSGEPEADEPPRSAPRHYTVAAGDTWIKIARRTLGDDKRWREIRDANPSSHNGLNVGMRLTIPDR